MGSLLEAICDPRRVPAARPISGGFATGPCSSQVLGGSGAPPTSRCEGRTTYAVHRKGAPLSSWAVCVVGPFVRRCVCQRVLPGIGHHPLVVQDTYLRWACPGLSVRRAGCCITRVLLSHPRGGGVNSGTHPPRILAYPQTDKCPSPPRGGGGGDTHPPTHPPILAPLWAWGRHRNCGVLVLPPPHPAQSTNNPSPFMGVGQRQELWGSSVTPSASGTKHKQS